MIAKETSAKTEQWVVSPGLNPNNEQLQFICFDMFCSYYFIVLLQNKLLTETGENLVSVQPRISAHPKSPKIK